LKRESRKKEDAMNEQIKQSLSPLFSAIVFKWEGKAKAPRFPPIFLCSVSFCSFMKFWTRVLFVRACVVCLVVFFLLSSIAAASPPSASFLILFLMSLVFCVFLSSLSSQSCCCSCCSCSYSCCCCCCCRVDFLSTLIPPKR